MRIFGSVGKARTAVAADAGVVLRLRRRARGHRALWAPAGVQRDVRTGGTAGPLVGSEYAEKLLIGGRKERMASLLTDEFVRENGLPADPEASGADCPLAQTKTAAHKAAFRRPSAHGVRAWPASSTRRSRPGGCGRLHIGGGVGARNLEHAVGGEKAAHFVLAGDVVPAKKT